MALNVHLLNVRGFGWFFTANDAFDPSEGPYRITSIGPGQTASPSVFIQKLGTANRRCVPFSRLELRPLIDVN